MANRVLSDFTASVTELKRNPMGTAASGDGATVAILNRNAPLFIAFQLMNTMQWLTG